MTFPPPLPPGTEAPAKQEPAQTATVPATPKRDTQPKLMSTPGSHDGTSARADLFPGIKQDLLSHQQCEFDAMLKVLLRKALVSEDTQLNDTNIFYASCLNYSLSCKEKAKAESDRYAPFVTTFNKALDDLHKVLLPFHHVVVYCLTKYHTIQLRPQIQFRTPEKELILCRNAEHVVKGDHDGNTTSTKPDIVLTTRDAAYRCLKATSDDDLLKCASKQPLKGQNFEWADMISVFEFKLLSKQLLELLDALAYNDTELKVKYPPFEDVEAASPPGKMRQATAATQTTKRKSESENDCMAIHASVPCTGRQKKRQQRGAPTRDAIEQEHKQQESDKRSDQKAELEEQAPREDKEPGDRPPPMVQAAMYAAEMLCCSIAVAHAINAIFFDDVMYVWWYDRQGAIQCSGISFVKDLPRFLAFLFALQRLPLVTWRVADDLDPLVKLRLTSRQTYTYGPPKRMTIGTADIEMDPGPKFVLHKPHCLVGRGTRCLKVKGSWTDKDNKYHCSDKLVLKIYWPDSSRESEIDLVKKAIERGDEYIKKHMPQIIASQDFAAYDTKHVRGLLGLAPCKRKVKKEDGTFEEVDVVGSRILRVMVSEELNPITSLQGEMFLNAFFQIQLCHYKVWKVGIHHNDPSLSNFMYDEVDGDILGVPNDWDFAIDEHNDPQHHGLERTGTVPYMALDLLENSQGQIRHLYRHDHEATIWIATWVVLCYKNGEYVGNSHNERLALWRTGSYADCAVEKFAFLRKLWKQKPQEEWKKEWFIVESLLEQLYQRMNDRNTAESQRRKTARRLGIPYQKLVEKDDPNEVLRAQWVVLEDLAAEDPDVGYVLRYKPDFSVKESAGKADICLNMGFEYAEKEDSDACTVNTRSINAMWEEPQM
ncbi:hypothetical protein K474DRAFT_1675272 [Panus rudis PR-1116 ss-1]|nr:hypothetical protein K474DRAFT_1675272 [Panus rudis PR-1116 ss-1]